MGAMGEQGISTQVSNGVTPNPGRAFGVSAKPLVWVRLVVLVGTGGCRGASGQLLQT